MQKLSQQQVQTTAQVLLAFLSSDSANVPGSMLEGVVSGKSLLRALIEGSLIVIQASAPGADAKAAKVPQAGPKDKAGAGAPEPIEDVVEDDYGPEESVEEAA